MSAFKCSELADFAQHNQTSSKFHSVKSSRQDLNAAVVLWFLCPFSCPSTKESLTQSLKSILAL